MMKNKKRTNLIWTIVFWVAVASVVLGCCIPTNRTFSTRKTTTKASDTEKTTTTEKKKTTTKSSTSKSETTEETPNEGANENTESTKSGEGGSWDDFSYEDFVNLFIDGDFSGVTPEFKEVMDSYEAFYDEYLAFMKTYLSGEGDIIGMLEDYYDMLARMEEWTEKIDAIDEATLSPADDAYYLYVTARILDKYLAFYTNSDGETTQAGTDPSDRPQRTNDGATYEAKFGVWSMTVPEYWEKDNDASIYQSFAESGEGTAMLQAISSYDDVDPVGFYWLEDEEEKAAVVDMLISSMSQGGGMSDFQVVSDEVVETDQIKGVMWTVRFKANGYPSTMFFVCYPSESDNNWVYITCIYTDASKYQYEQDFRNMIKSIKLVG